VEKLGYLRMCPQPFDRVVLALEFLFRKQLMDEHMARTAKICHPRPDVLAVKQLLVFLVCVPRSRDQMVTSDLNFAAPTQLADSRFRHPG